MLTALSDPLRLTFRLPFPWNPCIQSVAARVSRGSTDFAPTVLRNLANFFQIIFGAIDDHLGFCQVGCGIHVVSGRSDLILQLAEILLNTTSRATMEGKISHDDQSKRVTRMSLSHTYSFDRPSPPPEKHLRPTFPTTRKNAA